MSMQNALKMRWVLMIDELVKSPFLLNLGIQELRNCELFKALTTTSILKNGQIATFYGTVMINAKKICSFQAIGKDRERPFMPKLWQNHGKNGPSIKKIPKCAAGKTP